MSVTVTEDRLLVTVAPEGPLDDDAVGEVREVVDRALVGGASRVVLTLQKVPWASSLGLELIVELARRIGDAEGRLAIVGVGDVMREILRATRLDRRLAIFDSTESALQSMLSEV